MIAKYSFRARCVDEGVMRPLALRLWHRLGHPRCKNCLSTLARASAYNLRESIHRAGQSASSFPITPLPRATAGLPLRRSAGEATQVDCTQVVASPAGKMYYLLVPSPSLRPRPRSSRSGASLFRRAQSPIVSKSAFLRRTTDSSRADPAEVKAAEEAIAR